MTVTLEEAAAEARKVLATGDLSAVHCNTLGWFHALRGDAGGAAQWFRQALEIAPRDPEALIGLAGLLRDAGRLRDAALHCDVAIAAAPSYPEAWLERARVMASGGAMEEAARCYREVVALVPDHGAAHAGLASLAARDGDEPAVRIHAQAALAQDPHDPMASAALAAIELETGDAARARAIAENAAAALPGASAERAHLLSLVGDARDRCDDPVGAEAAYAQANADFAAVHAPLFAGRTSHRAFIESISDQIAQMRPGPSPQPHTARGAAQTHVFVLGYPRSGNTLLENILASLTDTLALEERPTLREADQAFLVEGGLAGLDALDESGLMPFRESYWRHVASAGLAVAGRCFVDMDPLKSIRLPLIARLFPDAHILLVRRDPRDVVWSCFRTNFALTNAAMDFTTLEGTARHYAALMTLIERARERLPLKLLEVPYHCLVQDFDAQTRAICAFIGQPWSENLRRFDRTAKTRGVATASARQVRRGLFDGTRQWERHAAFLATVEPILAPWVERLGYDR
ncbi:tetratricopeptide repeat-containing sulfotransferase family protein [Novosphingobium huizhouense]|uniref:tetratricopeptide repeat-containing sulfotransferase family protein n=1 Tax=Novosphingobium huizhouense TaxID=2866625 RepID=UPI001CD8323B|nr:sulfotransferase [Novosphingobium huizhouense]